MMNALSNSEVPQISEVLDQLGMPAFLLDVEGPGRFRFAHISTRHTLETGIDAAAFIGKTPHEILPERQAATIISNYERCRISGKVENYEETLELETGQRWWRTSLSPIFNSEATPCVKQIVGVAADITDAKLIQLEQTTQLSSQLAAAEKARSIAANCMMDAQAPMRGVLAWLDILRDGFLDLGDGKIDEINQISLMVGDAIVDMDGFIQGLGKVQHTKNAQTPIDLGHMCRDLAAIVDPIGRMDIVLPDETVQGDWAVTQIVLRCLLQQAVRRAVSKIELQVVAEGADQIGFVITDDSAFATSPAEWMRDVSATAALVKERGGTLTTTSSLEDGARTYVTLPGRLIMERAEEAYQGQRRKRA